jgi:hypothetical protein
MELLGEKIRFRGRLPDLVGVLHRLAWPHGLAGRLAAGYADPGPASACLHSAMACLWGHSPLRSRVWHEKALGRAGAQTISN